MAFFLLLLYNLIGDNMYFYNYVKSLEGKVNIYIDMDGVVADFDAVNYEKEKHNDNVYQEKRPIKTTINILKEISTLPNVTLYILSCTKYERQINGKLIWLEKNMSFIDKDKINIISREENNNEKSHIIKREFLKNNLDNNFINIIIDDSHQVIDEIIYNNLNITPLHITSILD